MSRLRVGAGGTRDALWWAALVGTSLVARARPVAADEKQVCAQHYQQAQELRLQNRLRAAREELVACAQQSCPRFMQVECSQWLGEVDRSLPTVVVELRDPRGADVVIDRLRVDAEDVPPGATAFPVDPGDHSFRALGADGVAVERRLTVREGDRNLRVVLTEPTGAPHLAEAPTTGRPARASPASAYVLGAVGVVALGAFTYFFVSGDVEQQRLKGDCSPHCLSSDVAPVRHKYLAADVSLAAAALAGGGLLWVAFGRGHDHGVALGAGAGGGALRASLEGSF